MDHKQSRVIILMMISIFSSNHLHVDEDGYFNLYFSCNAQHVSDGFTPSSSPNLSTSFYETICPNMVSIATSTFRKLASSDNVVAPSLLRLILHDAFVQGCDASILVSPTTQNPLVERQHPNNIDIPQQAFDTINAIKQQLELVCPGVVSCADIVVFAAQQAVAFLQGPTWEVPFGRRDGRISLASMVEGNIPTPTMNVDDMLAIFEAKSLTLLDLVALSGAHTIGFAKCSHFMARLSPIIDPTMDPSFAQQLKQQCPLNESNNPIPFDPVSPFWFDTSYYNALQNRKGLLFSDQVLAIDNRTQGLVRTYASSPNEFFQAFVNSMVKMSSIGVLIGNAGDIRKNCSAINP